MATYDFWFSALANPEKIGSKELPVHENEPQPGFYRMRGKGGSNFDMIPVAIWEAGGSIIVKAGKTICDDPENIWSFCCRYPVSEEDYHDAMAGKMWPDSPPENDRAVAGNNLPDDPFEALVMEMQGEAEIAAELLAKPVDNKDTADKVANFSKRVAALGKKADELFAVEKRPVLDEAKRIDDKFRDVRDTAKTLTRKLKDHIDDFLAKEMAKERARQAEAARIAEEKRVAAEKAAAAAENTFPNPDDPEAEALKAKAEEAQRAADKAAKEAEERRVSAGRTGSKVSLRTVKFAVITDYDALLMALKDREEVRELVQSLANRAAKSDHQLPGMVIETKEQVV